LGSNRWIAFKRNIQIGLVVDQLKGELCGFANESFGPVRVLDARQLKQDSIGTLDTDIRLAHTEFINPVPDGFKGLLSGHFFNGCHFFVRQTKGKGKPAFNGVNRRDHEVGIIFRQKFFDSLLAFSSGNFCQNSVVRGPGNAQVFDPLFS